MGGSVQLSLVCTNSKNTKGPVAASDGPFGVNSTSGVHQICQVVTVKGPTVPPKLEST